MLSDSWFRKWIPEFFFDPLVHQWWDKYLSGRKLREYDKEFLSKHTEEGYLALFPEYWFHGGRYKITVLDSLLTLRHYEKTGIWKYFHIERNPSLYFEYLGDNK